MTLFKSIYVATILVPPKQFTDKANRVQTEFIFDNKSPKIKHYTLIGDYSVGGYKVWILRQFFLLGNSLGLKNFLTIFIHGSL